MDFIKYVVVFKRAFQRKNPVNEMMNDGGRADAQKGTPVERITPPTVFTIGSCSLTDQLYIY